MTNILEQAINCDDSDRAAKIIQDALGIESDEVANYRLPRWNASSVPASSATGSRPTRSSWPNNVADGRTSGFVRHLSTP
jgi:hypothetical protein